jgi:acyl-coenzyme A synthetase/AMP-(fatty) acid ligase
MSAPAEPLSLLGVLTRSDRLAGRQLRGATHTVKLIDVVRRSSLAAVDAAALAGRSVLIHVRDPLFAALALIELDGLARRVVIAPPDLPDAALPEVIDEAEIEAVVFDEEPPCETWRLRRARVTLPSGALWEIRPQPLLTEWVMFTSGTSGPPKMAVHTLEGLAGAIKPAPLGEPAPVWGTFYDIRRYGGLQILLRALMGEGSLVLTSPIEPAAQFLVRLGEAGVTHLTGTPSHWRRALMTPETARLAPRYVRLSGEIADPAVLAALKDRFGVTPVHAYASTEAGVGFEVRDGLAGFPASIVGQPGEVEIRVADGVLKLRSPRASLGYLNRTAGLLKDPDGFVDTGDLVELTGDRYAFVGRRGGVINVGGMKAHPEEIEAVINRHPAVHVCRVRARKNPITGAIVAADVVLKLQRQDADLARVKAEIMAECRAALAPFKVPASIEFVPELAVTAGGKLERAGA